MKTIYKVALMMALPLAVTNVCAQSSDGVPKIKLYESEEQDMKLTIGGRFMTDAAYYSTDYTPLNSGASIIEARLRSSLTYKNWFFYADFDFAKGKATQKNIYLEYNFLTNEDSHHILKLGYYNEPSTMSLNTSKYNLHFFTRPSSSIALSPKRALGVSYKYYDDAIFLDQGLFAENKYNNQEFGSQGFSVGGRWLYKPFSKSENMGGHIGAMARYAQINTGEMHDNVFETSLEYSSFLETRVDSDTKFLHAELPWAKNTLNLGFEALFYTPKFFIRGEYLHNKVYKERPDEKLFTNQLGGLWSWTTLESWQKSNPLRTSSFGGFYVELGRLLRGSAYSYNDKYSVLNGINKAGDLEIVARYSLTNLNDITEGDLFFVGKNKFYPNGVIVDYPDVSTSVAGGKLQTATLGVNYTFNAHTKLMLAYQFSNLDNVYYPNDTNIHTLQARAMFSF